MKRKKIYISVSNDLFSDQRVKKVCSSLHNIGFEITLLGRVLPSSSKITDRPYKIKRFALLFKKGPLFYASLNIRIFFYLLFRKADLLLANDLDTLAANYLVSKIKGIPLIYDSHEYFTEVPELQGRYSKKVWEFVEKLIFPKLKDVFTVNQSIANIYENKYGVKINILKNMPEKLKKFTPEDKKSLGIENIGKYIILQGAGINIDRGAEELVMSMKHVDNAILLIVGSGDVLPLLKRMVAEENLEEKVIFIPKQSPERLKSYTYYAEIGVSLDKNTNLNYRYSLPNKIFDYIQLGVPVLASDLPEVKRVVLDNNIGMICKEHSPISIANCIKEMLEKDYKTFKKNNLLLAAESLCWEMQENIIKKVYSKYL